MPSVTPGSGAPSGLPVERPATLYLNDEELVTLQSTPADLLDWAVGFLYGEGLIANLGAIERLSADNDRGLVWIDSAIVPREEGERRRYLTAGCGRGVTFSSIKDALELQPVPPGPVVDRDRLLAGMKRLQVGSELYAETGGVHGAGLLRLDTDELLIREDIGRHNAVDKVIGAALRAGWPLESTIALTTGRISYEATTKLARARIGLAASLTAATDQAVRLAARLGIDLVGYARSPGRLTVYTSGSRLS